jgi:serine/threonine protein kinase
MFPKPFRVTNFDGQSVDPFYTYGIWLVNPTALESPLDSNLKRILVRCLAAEPADRPSLRELLRWARWREAQPDWKEGQDEIRAWSNEHISQAPIVRSRLRTALYLGNLIKLTPCPSWKSPLLERLQVCKPALPLSAQMSWTASPKQQEFCASVAWRRGQTRQSSLSCVALHQ